MIQTTDSNSSPEPLTPSSSIRITLSSIPDLSTLFPRWLVLTLLAFTKTRRSHVLHSSKLSPLSIFHISDLLLLPPPSSARSITHLALVELKEKSRQRKKEFLFVLHK